MAWLPKYIPEIRAKWLFGALFYWRMGVTFITPIAGI